MSNFAISVLRKISFTLFLPISSFIACAQQSDRVLRYDRQVLSSTYPALVSSIRTAKEYVDSIKNIDTWVDDEGTVLKPGMRIKIHVKNEFEKIMIIQGAGFIDLNMIGSISVAEKKIELVKKEITERLAQFVKDPQVTIFVSSASILQDSPVRVHVFGMVGKPGQHVLRININLEGARWAAEGFIEGACIAQIIVIRKKQIIVCDFYKFFIEGYGSFENIWLENEDVILIPKMPPEEAQILAEWKYLEQFIIGKTTLKQLLEIFAKP